ncbi:hypothetical protein N7454_003415 [Penicillium verhagenii]|nr:hypothetical protein N7454_003415 [Penicillium verhagenii]
MADSSESQRSLLQEEDVVTVRPTNSWNPLGRSSPEPDYAFALNHYPSRDSFADEVFREVGLGLRLSDDSSATLTARANSRKHRESRDSFLSNKESPPTDSQPTTPGFLKTPQETPIISTPQQHVLNCPSRSPVLQRRFGWVPISIFVLALYATVFSGIYLVIAFWKPRWKNVGSGKSLSAATANLLSAFFAKTIELAYVTICVAFLGQVLSRRALTTNSRGISIADMGMRVWIMQPGSMLVHWETMRYSALTFLGAIALTSTFVAMLYTTAAEALVSPKLNPGPLEKTVIWGKVSAAFANDIYLEDTCKTPITISMDSAYRNSTCLELLHVGTAYHNYQQWISSWSELSPSNMSDKLSSRPPPTGSIWDNTTVTGSWIEIQNITELSKKHKRMMNNVTMAFPHGNVPAAAMDPRNNIRQPQEATGEGTYNIEASVPSPAVNVLCVGMNATELKPMIYSEWPYQHFNAVTWMQDIYSNEYIPKLPLYLNSTVVDSIFGFGPEYQQRPPTFGTYPAEFNTILYSTGIWPTAAIYLLGKPSASSPDYVMCSMQAKLTGVCSTLYDADSSGASLYTNCENSSNTLQYDRHVDNFKEGVWSPDWKNVADTWATAVNLGSGITVADASNERLIMQLMPAHDNKTDTWSLDPTLPSIGEALAVMAGSTLILSTQNTPFVQGWSYNLAESLETPAYENFTATIKAIGYSSGGTDKWQGVFYVILVCAFLTSAVCLVFMIIEARGHQITDFTEPQNLFALAMNSPQSAILRGACGCGPVGHQMKERWSIGMQENDEHYYIRAKADGASPEAQSTGYSRVNQMEVDDSDVKPFSPAVNEFRRISNRNSWLGKFY